LYGGGPSPPVNMIPKRFFILGLLYSGKWIVSSC
jgi:hypothetical protein